MKLNIEEGRLSLTQYSMALERINYYAFVAFMAAFFVFEKNVLNKIFYVNSVLLIIFICCDRKILMQAINSRVFQAVLVFASYLLVRTLLSENFNLDSFFRDVKACGRILFFLIAVSFFMHKEKERTYLLYAVVFASLIGCSIVLEEYFSGKYQTYGDLWTNTNFDNRIYFGGAFSIIAFFVSYLMGSNYLKMKWLKFSGIFFFLVSCFLIYFSQSRSAILGFSMIFLTSVLLYHKNRVKYLCSFFVVGFSFVLISNQYIFDAATFITRKDSGRFEIWRTAFDRILNAPIFGGGLSADLTIELGNIIMAKPHNLFLSIAIVGGVVGLILFLLIWILSARVVWQQRSKSFSRLVLPLLLFAVWFHFFDSLVIFDKPTVDWLILWLPVGLAMALEYHCENSSGNAGSKTDTVSSVAH